MSYIRKIWFPNREHSEVFTAIFVLCLYATHSLTIVHNAQLVHQRQPYPTYTTRWLSLRVTSTRRNNITRSLAAWKGYIRSYSTSPDKLCKSNFITAKMSILPGTTISVQHLLSYSYVFLYDPACVEWFRFVKPRATLRHRTPRSEIPPLLIPVPAKIIMNKIMKNITFTSD